MLTCATLYGRKSTGEMSFVLRMGPRCPIRMTGCVQRWSSADSLRQLSGDAPRNVLAGHVGDVDGIAVRATDPAYSTRDAPHEPAVRIDRSVTCRAANTPETASDAAGTCRRGKHETACDECDGNATDEPFFHCYSSDWTRKDVN